MQGSWRARLCWCGLFLAVLNAGCGKQPPSPPSPRPPTPLGAKFDLADTGVLAGRVTWDSEVPRVEPFRSPPSPSLPPPRAAVRDWPNPLRPLVANSARGLGDLAVFLRAVDPERARPWHQPPVRIEQRELQMKVHQGDVASRLGFVRRGEEAEMVSCDREDYLLRARGAACFTLPFLDPDQPLRRTLNETGIVELTGGAGRFWMRAFLFVSEHPYFARTDENGDFVLEQVPDGEYELALWMPRWQVSGTDYDPNCNLASRVTFRRPLELTRRVRVRRGETTQCDLSVSMAEVDR